MTQKPKHTPMMEQYFEIKSQYPDAFLFYRLGDFYEMFYEDAERVSQLLELTLTSRNKNAENPIPMCGIPHHAAKQYIETLVEKGYKVALCEQVEDPKQTKGMVRREVVQVITPGTVTDGDLMDSKRNNYLTAFHYDERTEQVGFAYTDLSTGEIKAAQLESIELLQIECSALQTREIVTCDDIPETLMKWFDLQGIVSSKIDYAELPVHLSELADDMDDPLIRKAVELLLSYLFSTQKRQLLHLQKAEQYEPNQFLKMDIFSKYNLELIKSIRTQDQKGTLLWLLDETQTAMGGRLLKQWIDRPLISVTEINRRQNMVESLMNAYFERMDLKNTLKQVYDLERLTAKVAFGTANARDLLQLKKSLNQVPTIRTIVTNLNQTGATRLLDHLSPMSELVSLIDRAIDEDAPLSLTEGSVIKKGYNENLDRYKEAMTHGKQWLAEMEAKERQTTGIKNLKIKYNRVFGYFIEVTKSNISDVPLERYERKQTLSNAERYVTDELKVLESQILEAQDKSQLLEYELFLEIREQIKTSIDSLQALAKTIATLDVLQSFADVSESYQYVKPELTQEGQQVHIVEGRHPVVEKVLGNQEYIPNTIEMDKDTTILLITGPNMSGKSTYMRQLALTVIMAQIGCFVPAQSAKLPIFDRIFTRIGASDDLISGQSTFMVEMMEANQALRNATSKSLILFDELGRGTATYDGMALAQAIIEYLHDHVHAKTLFSTHYHEITVLEESLPGLSNCHVGAIEQEGKLVFLHKMMEGPADKSYGIHVAQLAGLPKALLGRADELLTYFESQKSEEQPSIQKNQERPVDSVPSSTDQLSLFGLDESHQEIIDTLKGINLLNMTPLDALNILSQLQQKL